MINLRIAIGLAIAVGLAACCAADGGYFSRGREQTPTIPYQRAFVSWRDGKETLIVESVLNGPKGDYAWVVPLPSPPSKVEPCSRGTLETVSRVAKPDVQQTEWYFVFLAIMPLALVVWAGARSSGRPAQHPRSQAWPFVKTIFLGLVLVMMPCIVCWPVYAGPGSTGGLGDPVVVHSSGTAGAFDYQVISAADGSKLPAWLSAHGYTVPKGANPALRAYSAKGWVFAALRIRHDLRVPAAPHPVKFVFDAKRPVYPMALTGALNDHLRLDLFVVAPGPASTSELEVWRIQTVVPLGRPDSPAKPTTRPKWKPVGHPAVAPALWEGAVLTYLRGDLSKDQMSRDFDIEYGLGAVPDYEKRVSSIDAAAWESLCYWSVVAAAVLFLVGLWTAARNRIGKREWRNALLWVLTPCFAAAVVRFATTTRVNMVVVDNSRAFATRARSMTQDLTKGKPADVKDSFREWWGSRHGPPGDERFENDLPGCYTMAPLAGGWKVTVYDRFGNAEAFRVNANGKPIRTPGRRLEVENP